MADADPLLESMREDPPRIPDLDHLKSVARYRIGNRAFIHDLDPYADGRVVAYLGVSEPKDTSTAAEGDPEMTFLNIAPVGTMIATPDDGAYVIDLPDLDALSEAVRTRRRREAEHRRVILPAVKNLLERREEMHFDAAGEYGFHDLDEFQSLDDLDLDGTEWFHLGREVGMYRMANLAHRVLMRRLRSAYRGQRRWNSPDYDVIRSRRTTTIFDSINGDPEDD